ncbi:hypothetical protein GIX45_27310 [Erwinia sp. CPCC 100877]|nr:hypothetical protein [Erwinia sp. CPCC 100877]
MSLSFNSRDAETILSNELQQTKHFSEVVCAYGTETGFLLFVPKQRFIHLDLEKNVMQIVSLSAFHKIKNIESISLDDLSMFKYYRGGLAEAQFAIKVADSKKRTFRIPKRISTLSDKQKEFLKAVKFLK